MSFYNKKAAIITDQLAGGIGGAESITFAAADLMKYADIFTTVCDYSILPENIKKRGVKTSFIQHLPYAQKLYKAYLPLMPTAIEYLNLQEYDVIFSSHHCVAKGIIPRPDAVHLCYCHSPARYMWDMFWTYADLNNSYGYKRLISFLICNYLRMWDVSSSNRVDRYIANSSYTAARIKKFYNRKSEILYPPVDTEKFTYQESEDFYLMASRLVGYKRFDLAIQAFNESGKKLIIIGDGSDYKKLKAMAGPNVYMLGKVSSEALVNYMNRCKGFIFPGKEDFGIVMAEAQAAGKPVIAYKGGGALDIVRNDETGVLFEEQSLKSLNNAVNRAEYINWDHNLISGYAEQFDRKKFIRRLDNLLKNAQQAEEINYPDILAGQKVH